MTSEELLLPLPCQPWEIVSLLEEIYGDRLTILNWWKLDEIGLYNVTYNVTYNVHIYIYIYYIHTHICHHKLKLSMWLYIYIYNYNSIIYTFSVDWYDCRLWLLLLLLMVMLLSLSHVQTIVLVDRCMYIYTHILFVWTCVPWVIAVITHLFWSHLPRPIWSS